MVMLANHPMSDPAPPADPSPSGPVPVPQPLSQPAAAEAGAATMPLGYPPQYGYPPQMPMPQGYGMPGHPMPQGYPMQMPMHMPPGYPMQMPMPHMPPGYGYPPGYPMPPMYPGQAHGYPAQYPSYPASAPPPGYPVHIQQPPPAPVAVAVAVEPDVLTTALPAEPPVTTPAPALVSTAPPPASASPAAIQPEMQATVPQEPAVSAAEVSFPLAPPLVPRGTTLAAATSTAPRSRFGQLWQRAGGGSLTFSILVHAALVVIAGLIVFTTATQEKAVDFLPGGGTQQGQQASQDLKKQVQQKKRSKVNQSVPKSRLVSTSMNAALTLPDAPPDMLDLPSADIALSGGGKMGSGGYGSGGLGGGFGSGVGLGAAKGFVGMTLFGKLGGEGMPGVFYDMKQTPDRVATALADLASEADFANVINTAAGKKFSGKGLDQFFHSTQKMSFTYLLIPYMSAGEGPKAFKVENEVQPRAWMVHYSADIRPPTPGDYRFVGMFDDALIVYVNGKPVLDGSWYPIVDYGEKRKDEDIRQNFGGPPLPGTGNRQCYAGKWVKMEGLTRIDIVVGERPGGRVGGLLLVQAKKGKYAERADGTPILPVFAIGKPTLEDEARISDYTATGFEVAKESAVFSLTKDVFGEK